MKSIVSIRSFAVLLILIFSMDVGANNITRQSFEEIVHGSDLVVIGRVVGIEKSDYPYDRAIIRVMSTLKGDERRLINFAINSNMLGELPACCVKGKVYLLFLARNKIGDYYPINGPYGVYPIEND
ncbi:hypothetical protein [Pseudomonas sp. ATCC 13867]|uniref:hypothetical protein n=1 Tax=Pseudomonas sp. ATCC 13867 TaxID=1294143 RepID=UPI0012FECBA8|nr:hypothetical protein [Pseudomonas sp. ATCC 13867]